MGLQGLGKSLVNQLSHRPAARVATQRAEESVRTLAKDTLKLSSTRRETATKVVQAAWETSQPAYSTKVVDLHFKPATKADLKGMESFLPAKEAVSFEGKLRTFDFSGLKKEERLYGLVDMKRHDLPFTGVSPLNKRH